jgi:hypothetical protein
LRFLQGDYEDKQETYRCRRRQTDLVPCLDYSSILKMEAMCSSELHGYYNPENSTLREHINYGLLYCVDYYIVGLSLCVVWML